MDIELIEDSIILEATLIIGRKFGGSTDDKIHHLPFYSVSRQHVPFQSDIFFYLKIDTMDQDSKSVNNIRSLCSALVHFWWWQCATKTGNEKHPPVGRSVAAGGDVCLRT